MGKSAKASVFFGVLFRSDEDHPFVNEDDSEPTVDSPRYKLNEFDMRPKPDAICAMTVGYEDEPDYALYIHSTLQDAGDYTAEPLKPLVVPDIEPFLLYLREHDITQKPQWWLAPEYS